MLAGQALYYLSHISSLKSSVTVKNNYAMNICVGSHVDVSFPFSWISAQLCKCRVVFQGNGQTFPEWLYHLMVLITWLLLKLEFWTPGPNSWDSTCQVWPFVLISQIKRHGEGQRKETYHPAQDTPWEEAKWALCSSSAIFGVQTWARQRIRAGDKRCA
jgi:hypothetical protein